MPKLSLGWLRQNLAESIGKDLRPFGFKPNKQNTKLRKKLHKNVIEINFDCYTYTSKLEFRLLVMCLIPEIEEERKRFYHYLDRDFVKGWTFILSEGSYHPKSKELEAKFQSAATHVVVDDQTLIEGIEDCKKVFNTEISPMLPAFESLDGFQKLIGNCSSWSSNVALIEPGLLAAKMKGRKELVQLVTCLENEFQNSSKGIFQRVTKQLQEIMRYDEMSHLNNK